MISKEIFIEKANLIHNNKYHYSLLDYKNTLIKIKIICNEHGDFFQTPKKHLKGQGCPKCAYEKKFLTNIEFIKKANDIHKNKYKYYNDYKNYLTKIKIECETHGIFYKTPQKHICGQGCPKCKGYHKTTNDYIKIASNIHSNYYNYSEVVYKNSHNNIKIKCPKHGLFEQKAYLHLNGQGCPNCNRSKGEIKISKILDNNSIYYIQQKRFKNCKDKCQLPFDFYLPNINTCIEYDGIYHFEHRDDRGGLPGLLDRQIKDKIKDKFCSDNNIILLRISYNENIIEKLNLFLKNHIN